MTGERWEDKVNRLAKELSALGFTVVPTLPKGIFGPKCTDCEHRIIAATGGLILGRCGPCNTAFEEKQDREAAA